MNIFIVCSKHFYDRVNKIKEELEKKRTSNNLAKQFR